MTRHVTDIRPQTCTAVRGIDRRLPGVEAIPNVGSSGCAVGGSAELWDNDIADAMVGRLLGGRNRRKKQSRNFTTTSPCVFLKRIWTSTRSTHAPGLRSHRYRESGTLQPRERQDGAKARGRRLAPSCARSGITMSGVDQYRCHQHHAPPHPTPSDPPPRRRGGPPARLVGGRPAGVPRLLERPNRPFGTAASSGQAFRVDATPDAV